MTMTQVAALVSLIALTNTCDGVNVIVGQSAGNNQPGQRGELPIRRSE